MLAGYVASLVLGGLGGYLMGRGHSRGVTSGPASPRSEASSPARALPSAEEEIAWAIRQGPPLTVIYLAWLTQEASDPTSRLIESILVRLVRPYDAIVPLGEGRFLLVLPQVGEEAADTVALRLIQELRLLASVQLTSSEADLPRISLAGPVSAKRALDAALESSELAPPWRGDRGQLLHIGMAVLERPEAQLLGPLAPGSSLRLKEAGTEPAILASSTPIEVIDPIAWRVKSLEPGIRMLGERVQLILEHGRTWMRAEVEVLEIGGAELKLSPPQEVHRLPRRRAERFRLRLPVQLADLEGFTLNLSTDGFRAVFPLRAFRPGEILDGALALPEERLPVRVEVIKVRAAESAEGMIVGCRFVGLEARAEMALLGLLDRRPDIR